MNDNFADIAQSLCLIALFAAGIVSTWLFATGLWLLFGDTIVR
jgi:preprotein translocase subunit SecF